MVEEYPGGRRRTVDQGQLVRKVSGRAVVEDAVERAGFLRVIQAPNDRVRRQLYDEAMEKYDEIQWIQVIKSVYWRAREGRLMDGEEAYASRAKGYFHAEVSLLLGIPVEQVEEYIAQSIAKEDW